ncbi:MAG: ATP cone domain-containing protein, partial [Candidatus Nanopelagicales bacterium]
ACQGRPVSEDDLALLAQRVEDALRATGSAEIPAEEVGIAILGPLRELDVVAYLRFASVYRAFDTLADFEAEIALLRSEADLAAHPDLTDISTPDISTTDIASTDIAAPTRH